MCQQLLYTEEFKANVPHPISHQLNNSAAEVCGMKESVESTCNVVHEERKSDSQRPSLTLEEEAKESRLPVGLADYCLIIGREDTLVHCPKLAGKIAVLLNYVF